MKNSINNIKKRREELIDTLIKEKNNEQTVNYLADYFQTSKMTIRRDLRTLEEEGVIERFHGGAKLAQNFEHKNSGQNIYNEQIKNEIAKQAASFLEKHLTIYVNSGTTAISVIDYLRDLPLTIISNNPALYKKNINSESTAIITGGEIRNRKNVLVGDIAINTIKNIYADASIISCSGVSAKNGVSTNNYHEQQINEQMIKNTNQLVILVANHSKIGKDTNFVFSNISQIDILITDIYSDIQAVREIEDAGVRVIQVEV